MPSARPRPGGRNSAERVREYLDTLYRTESTGPVASIPAVPGFPDTEAKLWPGDLEVLLQMNTLLADLLERAMSRA